MAQSRIGETMNLNKKDHAACQTPRCDVLLWGMTKTYLANAFSLQMIPAGESASVNITPIPKTMAQMFLRRDPFQSFVGHANTAAILTDMLGVEVTVNRGSLTLTTGDELIVAQYVGPRLDDGATSLPDGARIDFLLVTRIPVTAS